MTKKKNVKKEKNTGSIKNMLKLNIIRAQNFAFIEFLNFITSKIVSKAKFYTKIKILCYNWV